jgi:WD40 repeat protein
MVLSPDGQTLAVATNHLNVELLQANTGKRTAVLGPATFPWGFDLTMPVAFSQDVKKIALIIYKEGLKSYISVRDAAGTRELKQIPFRTKDAFKPALPPEAERAKSRTTITIEHVSALTFSPDGKVLAAAVRFYCKCWGNKDPNPGLEERVFLEMEENVVRLWDASTGEQRLELTGHEAQINSLLFSPNGQTLATCSGDGAIRFWNTAMGRETRPALKSEGPLYCAADSPDGKWLAGGSRGAVLIWEVATGKLRHRLRSPASEVRSLAFTRDGQSLAGAGGDIIRLWNPNTGTFQGDLPAASHPVTTVAFSADGKTLFSGHKEEHVLRCWDVATFKPSPALSGHALPVRALGFTPDGKRVLTTTLEDTFHLWDPLSGKPCPSPGEDQQVLQTYWLGSVGRTSLLLCEDGVANGIGLLMTRKLWGLERLPGFFSCSVDGGRVLAVREKDKEPALVVTDSANKVLREYIWKEGGEVSAALSPDGRTVAAAGSKAVYFIEVASGKERRLEFGTQKRDLPFSTTSLKFSPDGSKVVLIGNGGTLRILSVKNGELLAEIAENAAQPITGVAFSPDGKTLLTCQFPNSLSVWEVFTGEQVRKESGAGFLLSPDNRLLAVLRQDGIGLYDLFSGKLFRQCKGQVGFVGNLTFSPDGRLLATGCDDTTVLIWDATTPEKRETPQPLDEGSLTQMWRDLEEGKAPKAYEAIGRLIEDSERTLPYLQKQLQTVRPADAAYLERLIAELDSDQFENRESASGELLKLGMIAEPRMRAALAKGPSLEMRKRLLDLLRNVEEKRKELSPEERSHIRAVQVLERIRTKEAQQLLKSLAEGAEGLPRTRDSWEALQRIQSKFGGGEKK